ncbi:MAG TPA: spondin domain-containing protein [Kofleriaceae bacterium]|nr:spondin domain-containing protein [Kofleriaceae bacterium]
MRSTLSALTLTALAGLAALAPACTDADDPVDPSPDAAPTPTPATIAVRIENVAPWTVLKAGLASTKLTPSPGPLGPGEAFDVTFSAGRGQRFSFAAMLGESNDWFFGPGPDGIALHDAQGTPIAGDVTAQVGLWDAGTEIDQEPAVGDSTGPRQPAPDAGAADPDPTVREVPSTTILAGGATFTRPAVDQMIRVTLMPGANRQITVRIQNVSTSTTLVTTAGTRDIHVSPVVWTLHTTPAPLFTPGQPDRGHGLELVAESGRGADLAGVLAVLTGPATPISPTVWAVHRGPNPLYTLGAADPGDGLERLAENGDPMPLATALATARTGLVASGAITTPVGATSPGAARPGSAYETELTVVPGDRLSFATMFGQSNDWFFATDPDGIELFTPDGTPMAGDVTHMVAIYDAGTELDEELAIGANTGPQQPAPDSGPADPIDHVRAVGSRYPFPASTHLRVTLSPR